MWGEIVGAAAPALIGGLGSLFGGGGSGGGGRKEYRRDIESQDLLWDLTTSNMAMMGDPRVAQWMKARGGANAQNMIPGAMTTTPDYNKPRPMFSQEEPTIAAQRLAAPIDPALVQTNGTGAVDPFQAAMRGTAGRMFG